VGMKRSSYPVYYRVITKAIFFEIFSSICKEE